LTLEARERSAGDAAPFIQLLVDTRRELRQARQYQLADGIRQKLEAMGIILEDTASGTNWKVKS